MSSAVELSAPGLLTAFTATRRQSLALCTPLSPEDMMVQSSPEASPAKWHLAHTTWFFETFVLREYLAGYKPFHPDFLWLFNSYYNDVSDQPEKKLRASFSRPGIEQILAYRQHVEDGIVRLEQRGMPAEAAERIELGIHHEQQHQELLCYDIKHAFWSNPLHPAYAEGGTFKSGTSPLRWRNFAGGLTEIGHAGNGFAYDNESPRHSVFLQPFALASRAVTCAEYLAFMEDGGSQTASEQNGEENNPLGLHGRAPPFKLMSEHPRGSACGARPSNSKPPLRRTAKSSMYFIEVAGERRECLVQDFRCQHGILCDELVDLVQLSGDRVGA